MDGIATQILKDAYGSVGSGELLFVGGDDSADLRVVYWKKTAPSTKQWCLAVPHTYGVDDDLRAPDPAEQRK